MIQLYEPAAIRVTDEHVRRPLAGTSEQRVKLGHDLMKRARMGADLAPAVAGAVVRANACECRDAWLHEAPLDGKISKAGLENDRGLPLLGLTSAIQMETPSANVDELARRAEWRRVVADVLCVRDATRGSQTTDDGEREESRV